MKTRVATTEIIEPVETPGRPQGDWRPAPAGVRNAVLNAARFTGSHNTIYPFLNFIYVLDGKLYASDNRCIVEVDLGASNLGFGALTPADVRVLKARSDAPSEILLSTDCTAFMWLDHGWCRVDRAENEQTTGIEHAVQCRTLIAKFWREGTPAEGLSKAVSEAIETADDAEVSVLGSRWHAPSLAKVAKLARRFEASESPAAFTFEKGRGLIVKASSRKA